ncbi:FAD-dependent oxidoreductase [Clostridium uliginosum]|uniref:2-enoate reductase n=1 Tax=Clostridium uliginosum TaxID=119641 RepID=A0A1I1PW51_9CLOT|nr:FAD-dependent oxidoreductase [Clostridium uliginosum]SFD14141.1 2-enoate reductase [Clostridium uliginosum]
MEKKNIFKPIKIGKVEVKNRIAMAPMGTVGLVTPDGCFSQRAIDYYVERAKGGTGLIITGIVKAENEIEKLKMPIFPCATTNPIHFAQVATELTERVHAYGSKIFLQVTMGLGRSANPKIVDGQPVAPSAIPNYWDPSVTCRELTTNEVETIIKKFGDTAEIAVESGFDGIEVHAVHEGYLLDQFTISLFNRRTDKFGGNSKERLTLPIEILKEIKNRVGQDFPVGVRYSIKSFIKDWCQGGLPEEEFKELGRDLEEGLESAKILEEAGYDEFNADGGTYDAWYWAHPPVYQKHGCYLSLTEKLKKVVKVPVLVAGRMEIPELAEKALEENKADMVELGRELLADPYWPKKVLAGQNERIRPCIGCQVACLGRIFAGKSISCAVNPSTGHEEQYALKPALKTKNVMVVGGGIAGMEAARVAAIRGHKVTIYEKTDKLGGHIIAGGVPDFKEDDRRLLDWYKNELKELNVDIKFGVEVTEELIDKEKPEVIIAATGSTSIVLNVEGVDRDNVATATEVLLGEKSVKNNKVTVIGGGLVGCETALWLAKQGKEVTILESLEDLMIAGNPVPHANRIMLIDLLKMHKVKVLTNKYVYEIKEKSIVVADNKHKKSEVDAENVVLAVGYASDTKLYDKLRDKVPELYLIGDARKAANILNAVWDAYEVARNI